MGALIDSYAQGPSCFYTCGILAWPPCHEVGELCLPWEPFISGDKMTLSPNCLHKPHKHHLYHHDVTTNPW